MSIVVVAGSTAGGALLSSALSHASNPAEARATVFDNKYYTARVPVTVRVARGGAAEGEERNEGGGEGSAPCLALVGTFRSTPTANGLIGEDGDAVLSGMARLIEHHSPETVALLVDVQVGEAPDAGEDERAPSLPVPVEQRLTAWCRAHGPAELIPANLADVAFNPAAWRQDAQREKWGVARLHEMLETVMWPSMQRKTGAGLGAAPEATKQQGGVPTTTTQAAPADPPAASSMAAAPSAPAAQRGKPPKTPKPCCLFFSLSDFAGGNGGDCPASSTSTSSSNFAERSAESLALFNLFDRGDIENDEDEDDDSEGEDDAFRVPSKATRLPRLATKARAFAFKISNKYYDAAVRLVAKTLPSDDSTILEALAHDLQDAHCQALVGVVPATPALPSASETELARRLERMQRALKQVRSMSGVGTTVLLLEGLCRVTGSNDSAAGLGMELASGMSLEMRAALRTWCVQEGVEMIEADGRRRVAISAEAGEERQRGGAGGGGNAGVAPLLVTQGAREKVGYARLREALGVVGWRNAVMRGGSEARGATGEEVVRVASTSVATIAETTTTAEGGVTRGDEKTRDRGHSPIGLSGDGSSSSIESALAPSSKTDQGDDADEFWDAMMSAARVGGGGEDAAGGEDMDMESLSSLVNQARAVRRAGDAGAMTDQERQEAALRVAMQMAALMGIDEDDDA